MANLYYHLIFTAIDRTFNLFPSYTFKTSLIRTIIYINIISNNNIDKVVGDQIKHHVHLADIHDDLRQQALSLMNLQKAKRIIRNHILSKGLILNRIKSSGDLGGANRLPIDCQLIIASFIK
jgi:hypothetical protein